MEMSSLRNKIIDNDYLTLCTLIIASVFCRAPFIFQGFAEYDAASIAVSIIDYLNHGYEGNFTNLYFLDVIPGYVLYIKLFMRIFDNDYTYLTTVMNYTNAVVGTLIIIPCYFFTKKLSDNKPIAFCTTLAFIFVPSVFRLSIFGMPPLLPLFFFISSLYFFLLWVDNSKYAYLLLSFLALTTTIFFKSDFTLGVGAFPGLLYLKGTKDKHKGLLTISIIFLSVISFLFLRQWTMGQRYAGPELGSTTSISNFIKWAERFFMPLYNHLLNKNYGLVFRAQIQPVIYAIGVVNFLIASFAFFYYLIKKRYDILVFAISWSALPTTLWLIMYPNTQRHNMLSILPFLIIIFMFVYEKGPKLFFTLTFLLILTNLILTTPAPLTNVTGFKFLQDQINVSNRANDLHTVAKRIAQIDDEKVIFTTPGLKPYLLYELFSATPGYKTIKIDDHCYEINDRKCILCFNTAPATLRAAIANNNLEKYTIITPFLSLRSLKEEGFNVIDNNDIRSWTRYKGSIPRLEVSSEI